MNEDRYEVMLGYARELLDALNSIYEALERIAVGLEAGDSENGGE